MMKLPGTSLFFTIPNSIYPDLPRFIHLPVYPVHSGLYPICLILANPPFDPQRGSLISDYRGGGGGGSHLRSHEKWTLFYSVLYILFSIPNRSEDMKIRPTQRGSPRTDTEWPIMHMGPKGSRSDQFKEVQETNFPKTAKEVKDRLHFSWLFLSLA